MPTTIAIVSDTHMRIGIVHDSGQKNGRLERRRSPFKSMGRAVVEGSDIRFELIDLGT